MQVKRFVLSSLVLLAVAIVWNGLLHLVLLRNADAVVRHLYRPDLADRMWLGLLVTAAVVILFLYGYRRFARTGSTREAVGYGAFFALLTGVLVDLNQYMLFPIPGWLAWLWFLGGLAEFIVYGIIARTLYPVSKATQEL
jgi:hypothetical protein